MPGFSTRTRSYSTPSRAAGWGRKLCMNTSAVRTRRISAACPAGCLRSRTRLRLLRLQPRKNEAMPAWCAGPSWRVVSPSGDSILTTSAPRSPSVWLASGPRITVVASRMRTPSSGPGMERTLLLQVERLDGQVGHVAADRERGGRGRGRRVEHVDGVGGGHDAEVIHERAVGAHRLRADAGPPRGEIVGDQVRDEPLERLDERRLAERAVHLVRSHAPVAARQ